MNSCGDSAVMGAMADMVARSPSFNGSSRTSSLLSGLLNREGAASPLSHKRSGSSSLQGGLLLSTQSGSWQQASAAARRSASGPVPPFAATPEEVSVRLPLLPLSTNDHARRSDSAPVSPFAATSEEVSVRLPLLPFSSTRNRGRDGTIPPAAAPAAGQVTKAPAHPEMVHHGCIGNLQAGRKPSEEGGLMVTACWHEVTAKPFFDPVTGRCGPHTFEAVLFGESCLSRPVFLLRYIFILAGILCLFPELFPLIIHAGMPSC